jgi:hypothetical protein
MDTEHALLFGGPLSGTQHPVKGPVLDVSVRGVIHRYIAADSPQGLDEDIPVYWYDGALSAESTQTSL